MVEGTIKATGLLDADRRRSVRGSSSRGGSNQKNLRNPSFSLFAIVKG